MIRRMRPCGAVYHDQIHPEVGWTYARIQTWFPFNIQKPSSNTIPVTTTGWSTKRSAVRSAIEDMSRPALGVEWADTSKMVVTGPVPPGRWISVQVNAYRGPHATFISSRAGRRRAHRASVSRNHRAADHGRGERAGLARVAAARSGPTSTPLKTPLPGLRPVDRRGRSPQGPRAGVGARPTAPSAASSLWVGRWPMGTPWRSWLG